MKKWPGQKVLSVRRKRTGQPSAKPWPHDEKTHFGNDEMPKRVRDETGRCSQDAAGRAGDRTGVEAQAITAPPGCARAPLGVDLHARNRPWAEVTAAADFHFDYETCWRASRAGSEIAERGRGSRSTASPDVPTVSDDGE